MNPEQVETSVRVIRKYFADAAVWLFGSRVDDTRKGGDFDFYVETSMPDIALSMARARGELTDSLGMKASVARIKRSGMRGVPAAMADSRIPLRFIRATALCKTA